MKKIAIVLFVCLAGCGMSFESTRVENGRPIAHTRSYVGYASVEETTEYDRPLMETCLANVGDLPQIVTKDGQTIDTAATWCLQNTKKELDRNNHQLDHEAEEHYYEGFYYH